MNEIKESDWKLLRKLTPTALDRLSKRILDEISLASGQQSKTQHQRYVDAYKIMENGDNEMARAFNDLKRSTAVTKLSLMKYMGLITAEELSEFSEETQQKVAARQEVFR